MIIDLILDRQDGVPYNKKDFYIRVQQYEEDLYDGKEFPISKAMDSGTNQDVQRALARYIVDFDYPPEIITYIKSKRWI